MNYQKNMNEPGNPPPLGGVLRDKPAGFSKKTKAEPDAWAVFAGAAFGAAITALILFLLPS